MLAVQHAVHVAIQLLARDLVAEQRTLRQQVIRPQRTRGMLQRGRRLQRKQRFVQGTGRPLRAGTHRAQVERRLGERAGHRGARHFRRNGGLHAHADEHVPPVRADQWGLAAQIGNGFAHRGGGGAERFRRFAADGETAEIPAPADDVEQ